MKALPEKDHARLLELWLQISKIQEEIEDMIKFTESHDEKLSLSNISDGLYDVYDKIGERWS